MDDSAYTQRLIVAAILCFGVIVVWEQLYPSARPPAPVTAADAGVASSTAATTSSGAVATRPPVPSSTTTAAAPPAAATMKVPPREFSFSGSVDDGGTAIPYELTLTNVGGGIAKFVLPSYYERNSSNERTEDPISLAESEWGEDLDRQMASIEFVDGSTFRLPSKPVYEVAESSDRRVLYRYATPEGIVIEREYSLDPEAFQIEMAVTVRNGSPSPQSHRLRINTVLDKTEASEGGMLFMPPPDHLSGLCFTDDQVEREAQKSLAEESMTFSEGVKWVAMDRQYFVAAIIQRDGVEAECRLSGKDSTARAGLVLPEVQLEPGEERRHKFTAYLGVKKASLLTRVDAQLESAIDYTIMGLNLAIICQGLLYLMSLFFSVTGSWGVAILGLTVLVKGILFPLNQRSGKSMRAMAALKPEMEAVRTQYSDDRQRQSEELMKLYQKHSVNPASGCVPILIQMPIWFALYRALWVSVDLYQAEFLWLTDLTAKDPYYILPVTLMVVMFVQQKMMPTAMDPAQQKIMQYMMPLMFGGFMIALPSGLVFYILVNSLLTIVQQHFINKTMGPVGGPPSAQPATA